ncbi:hypothetical protein M1N51_01240 [Peptococcaceae bacterium]|nr:hypothetical protein [Peptococcaceae bacterium]MCL0062757.1 hypothetical protein [Peptococcaceae bacterium]MCL0071824.1 hypothetical protein [Peptococcaceae bacterium]
MQIQVVVNGEIDEIQKEQIIAEEKMRFEKMGKELGKVEITVNGDEITTKSFEKSPIRRVRRVTGYMSTVDRFNAAKVDELNDRVIHC